MIIWNRCMFMRLDVNESYRFHLDLYFNVNKLELNAQPARNGANRRIGLSVGCS